MIHLSLNQMPFRVSEVRKLSMKLEWNVLIFDLSVKSLMELDS
jgi:hypothetical protein